MNGMNQKKNHLIKLTQSENIFFFFGCTESAFVLDIVWHFVAISLAEIKSKYKKKVYWTDCVSFWRVYITHGTVVNVRFCGKYNGGVGDQIGKKEDDEKHCDDYHHHYQYYMF